MSVGRNAYVKVRDFGPVRLTGTSMPTSTIPYHAVDRLECAVCEGPISSGDMFTLALAPGHGRVRVPHCRACRPFEISMDAIEKARQRGRGDRPGHVA